jgi:hypothetical protein
MNDWATTSSLATGVGTLVLAVATFASVRSSNRSARTAERAARTAERSLLAGQRPLLVTSRLQDPTQKVVFVDGKRLPVTGGGATLEVTKDVVYLAMSIRNVGTGLAVLRGWHLLLHIQPERTHPPLEEFTAHSRDIYVAPADDGFWQAALRDPATPQFKETAAKIEAGEAFIVSVLYGDYEGGQRVISQFTLRRSEDTERWLASVIRHFNVDRPDPR